MRTTWAFLLLLPLLIVPFSVAQADETEADRWQKGIRSYYRHYKTIEVMPSGLRTFSPCRNDTEKEFEFEPWTLWLRLSETDTDENLFYKHFRIGVRKVARGVDVVALYEKAKRRGCPASYANEAVVQAGEYVFRLDATCGEMHSLLVYEVADLIDMIRSNGATPAARMIFDSCGNRDITVVPVDEVLQNGRKKRKFYGHQLPDDRDQKKASSRTMPEQRTLP